MVPGLRSVHFGLALCLGLFLFVHLGNHLLFLAGIEAHLWAMTGLRSVYRFPVVEWVLFAGFAVQSFVGLRLLLRRGRPHGGWAWAQVLSGAYLLFFLLQHLGAVVATRLGYPEVDTTSWWAVSVVSQRPFSLYFAPYYLLAFVAISTHVAAAIRFRLWPRTTPIWVWALPVLGVLAGIAVVSAMVSAGQAGLPPVNQAYLDSYWGF